MTYDVPKSLLCKNILWSFGDFELYPKFSNLDQLLFCTTTYLNISLKLPPKLGDVSRGILFNLCKSTLVFFENFEQTILFCSLVQFGIFYFNSIFVCSVAHDFFPAYSPPYKTLKSRRVDPLGYFWSMK